MTFLALSPMLVGPFLAIGAIDLRAWRRNRQFDRHCRQALAIR